MNEDVVVIYHNNCYDGVCSAWVAHRFFGPGAQYVPLNYSDQPPDVRGKRVFLIDFSLKRGLMNQLCDVAESVVVLDHHATAEKELAGLADVHANTVVIFDMNRSGAGIAWDYFYPGEDRPDLINYVEDRDLWRYELDNSRTINAYIQSFDINLAVWLEEFEGFRGELQGEEVYAAGEALLRQQSKLVREICEHASIRNLPAFELGSWPKIRDMMLKYGQPVYVQTSILMSEVCEQMLKDHLEVQFCMYSFERKDVKTQYGLRSRTGSDVDVSEIAKLYGGGGHKHAAGFEI
jgi:oligoribonuclease NrnB/cAMP/cGMP phosphodiesterase (DHH superfamily)